MEPISLSNYEMLAILKAVQTRGPISSSSISIAIGMPCEKIDKVLRCPGINGKYVNSESDGTWTLSEAGESYVNVIERKAYVSPWFTFFVILLGLSGVFLFKTLDYRSINVLLMDCLLVLIYFLLNVKKRLFGNTLNKYYPVNDDKRKIYINQKIEQCDQPAYGLYVTTLKYDDSNDKIFIRSKLKLSIGQRLKYHGRSCTVIDVIPWDKLRPTHFNSESGSVETKETVRSFTPVIFTECTKKEVDKSRNIVKNINEKKQDGNTKSSEEIKDPVTGLYNSKLYSCCNVQHPQRPAVTLQFVDLSGEYKVGDSFIYCGHSVVIKSIEKKYGKELKVFGTYIKYTPSYANGSNMMRESLEIVEYLKQRNVKYLVHFTPISNLYSISKKGIVPRSELSNRDAIFTDSDRLDQMCDCSCFSISFPNYRMLYKKQEELHCQFAILMINIDYLKKIECNKVSFYPNNASSAGFTGNGAFDKLHGPKAAQELFAEEINLREGGSFKRSLNKTIKDYWTTNPQAEVLIKGTVPFEYVELIVVKDYKSYVDAMKPFMGTPIINMIKVDESLFEMRRDYRNFFRIR